MKTAKYILVIITASILFGCQKDPLAEINEGAWNKERNILNISFVGMIGRPTIVRNDSTATIEFLYNEGLGTDYSSIELSSIEVSFGAKASVEAGGKLDFNNSDNTAIVSVIPITGEALNWTVKLKPFSEPLVGNWTVSQMRILINVMGDNPEWGGTWDEANIASFLPESAFEMDNTLTFEMIDFNAIGNSYGTFTNQSGADSKYGVFTNTVKSWDFDSKYRLLPKGSGTWEKKYSNNTIMFTDAKGTVTTANLINVTDGIKIQFAYTESIFWDNPWDDFAKISQETKYFWYTIKKKI
jgi:hypothetical protein